MTDTPRFLNAGNAGPFILDGTRSLLIGNRSVAIIDPGSDVDSHVRALASAVESADETVILLTHGHADHAAAAPALARRIGAEVRGPEGVAEADVVISEGSSWSTDVGTLVAVSTPGHTRHHLCFHEARSGALFVGDLVLGEGDTTWVAEYPGCVRDYLASLERVRALGPSVLYPAHGDPLTDPDDAIDRFERHRRERIEQARSAMEAHPGADIDELVDAVYGPTLPAEMRGAAARSLGALVDYLTDGE